MQTERFTFSSEPSIVGRTLKGIAYAFGQATERGGRLVTFSKEGFVDALSRSDAYAFVGHDTNRILGHEKAGTVRLSVQPEGLAYEIDLPDTTDGRDTQTLVERGDLTSMSFGVLPGKYTDSKADGKTVRTFQSFDLFDISVVALPAFQGTSVMLHGRSLSDARSQAALARNRAYHKEI